MIKIDFCLPRHCYTFWMWLFNVWYCPDNKFTTGFWGVRVLGLSVEKREEWK